MNVVRAWLQAARPRVQIAVAVPLVYGQALAFATYREFNGTLAVLLQVFGVLYGCLVAFGNDAVDWPGDVENTTFNRYSGGSRVVPLRLITPFALAQAALLSLLALGALCVFMVFREGRAFMVVMAALGAHLFWMSGFPPFRLIYRAVAGEVLQGIILGLLLPSIGFYGQAGTAVGLHPGILVPGFLLGVAGNVAAALADTPADAKANKHTFPVRRGESSARATAFALLVVASLASPLAAPRVPVAAALVAGVLGVALTARAFPLLKTADSTDHAACERFTGRVLLVTIALPLLWAVALVVAA